MTPFLHLVARALPGTRPFAEAIAAWWFWKELRARFPDALAACLMPSHVHIVVRERLDAARIMLGALLSGFSRRAGKHRIWEGVRSEQIVASPAHLARQIRYVHLNPCRAKLVRDPLAWPCSTHRGVVGAELNPWVDPERLASALAFTRKDFVAWFHAYVSGDPSANVSGTPLPRAAGPRTVPAIPLETIVRAGFSATPASTRTDRRWIIAQLAACQGWTDFDLVGAALGTSARTVRRLLADPAPAMLRPALTCLGDSRLVFDSEQCRALRENTRAR